MPMRKLQNDVQLILRALADNREVAQIDRDHARIELRAELVHNRTIFQAGLDSIEQRLDRIELLIREAVGKPSAEHDR